MNLQSTPTGWDLPQLRTWLGTQFASIVQGWSKDHRADGGHSAIHEYGRVTPLGVWTDQPFLASTFTGNGTQTWTLTAADQTALRYTLIGNTLTMSWELVTTTVGGVANTELRIALPSGLRATARTNTTYRYSDNGTVGISLALVTERDTYIRLYLSAFGNWAASANNTSAAGQMSFEVETF